MLCLTVCMSLLRCGLDIDDECFLCSTPHEPYLRGSPGRIGAQQRSGYRAFTQGCMMAVCVWHHATGIPADVGRKVWGAECLRL